MEIPQIQIKNLDIRSINIPRTFIQDLPEWLTSSPPQAIPIYPPVTQQIGVPVIDMPGCVEAHEGSDKNDNLVGDDPKGSKIFCDAGMPSFNPIDYSPESLKYEYVAPVPPVESPPDEVTPETEVPPVKTPKETECPAPNQPRVGDLTASGDERVIGHELSEDGKTCVVLYEDTSPVQKYLPTANQVSTTASIAVVATAAAAATPLLLKVVKPIVKQIIKRIQKFLGKEPPAPSRLEIKANAIRAKRGLPPLKVKRPKKPR
tara:strand:+ start:138 stop:920 length:783 start_codon:yes stop_codon:yes gene_type:complete